MSLTLDWSRLFARDLARLRQQITAFPTDSLLWQTVPGITNSAGNLALHIEGNLSEYIGRQLAGRSYQRDRNAEFATRGLSQAELDSRIRDLELWLPDAVASLNEAALVNTYPTEVWGAPLPTGQFLLHLLGHMNYHMGQIDYLRRMLTGSGAIELAGLD